MSGKSSAERAQAAADKHLRMAERLATLLRRQIVALELDAGESYSEDTVKALMLLAKTLQAMHDMVRHEATMEARMARGGPRRADSRNDLPRKCMCGATPSSMEPRGKRLSSSGTHALSSNGLISNSWSSAASVNTSCVTCDSSRNESAMRVVSEVGFPLGV